MRVREGQERNGLQRRDLPQGGHLPILSNACPYWYAGWNYLSWLQFLLPLIGIFLEPPPPPTHYIFRHALCMLYQLITHHFSMVTKEKSK